VTLRLLTVPAELSWLLETSEQQIENVCVHILTGFCWALYVLSCDRVVNLLGTVRAVVRQSCKFVSYFGYLSTLY
jgi:hypothetical protein